MSQDSSFQKNHHVLQRDIRIIESSELERIHKDHGVWLLALHWALQNPTLSLRELSKCSWSSVRCETITTAWESLFQCLTTLLVKNFFLVSNIKKYILIQ